MIISKKYAQKLVRKGRAIITGLRWPNDIGCNPDDGCHFPEGFVWKSHNDRHYADTYRIVERLDIQRVDHYKE